jgi:hypothetical protein
MVLIEVMSSTRDVRERMKKKGVSSFILLLTFVLFTCLLLVAAMIVPLLFMHLVVSNVVQVIPRCGTRLAL